MTAKRPKRHFLLKGLRYHDHNRIMNVTVETVDASASNFEILDLDAIDQERTEEWAATLGAAIRRLQRLHGALTDPPGSRRALVCVLCEQPIPLTSRSDARYCSTECRQSAHRVKKRATG